MDADTLKCDVCGHAAIGVFSLPAPMSVPFCELCCTLGALPQWFVKFQLENSMPWYAESIIYHRGAYVTYGDTFDCSSSG